MRVCHEYVLCLRLEKAYKDWRHLSVACLSNLRTTWSNQWHHGRAVAAGCRKDLCRSGASRCSERSKKGGLKPNGDVSAQPPLCWNILNILSSISWPHLGGDLPALSMEAWPEPKGKSIIVFGGRPPWGLSVSPVTEEYNLP